jgi:lysophospholipase L1-like esterase
MKPINEIMQRLLPLIIATVLLSCSPVKKYQNSPEVLAWENDIREFEKLDKSEKYDQDAILFAGSSSIRLWTTLKSDMSPYPVIQRGYGGARLSDFAIYADRIIAPHPCRAIVIFIANDITGSEADKSPKEVAALFRNVLQTIRKTHPDTPVFWIAVTPTPARWSVWKDIQKAGSMIKDVCEHNRNTFFIRTDFAFLDENGKPRTEFFIDDKLHLNHQGYAIWTDIVKNELEKVIPVNK